MNYLIDWRELFGIGAAVLSTAAFFPQAIKVWKTRSVEDLSLVMYVMLWFGVILWVIYGFLIGSIALLLANSVTFILCTTILYCKLRYDTKALPNR